MTGSATGRALADVASDRPGIALAEVDATAALQRRLDHTYLITAGQLRRLAAAVGPGFRALEIGRRRVMTYHTVYFDSPDLALFRAHRQGNRRRFKVRIRTYADSGTSFVEVKTKAGRGETVKHRIPCAATEFAVLHGPAKDFVGQVIQQRYGMPVPHLIPVLESGYRRLTLIDPVAGQRVTCDIDLSWDSGTGHRVVGPDKVVVESKSTGRGRAEQILADCGIRPLRMSKYALGVALLHPQLPANKWDRLLRNEFGRQRAG